MSGAREQYDDPRMERLQNRIRELERFVDNCPFIDGSLVEDIAMTTASREVVHRLGREPKGFLVLKVTPDAAVGFSASQGTVDPKKIVKLEASATATVTFWFF
jgi:hypothetical protein